MPAVLPSATVHEPVTVFARHGGNLHRAEQRLDVACDPAAIGAERADLLWLLAPCQEPACSGSFR
jgi:hypothetical protein